MSQPEILGKNLQIVFPNGERRSGDFLDSAGTKNQKLRSTNFPLSIFQKIFGCKLIVRFITLYRVLNRFVFNRVLNRLRIQSSMYECIRI